MSLRAARPDVVRAAAAMVPVVTDAADALEAAGRLPDVIAQGLTAAGLDHLFLPASSGGPEVDPVSALLAIETLARADGSVAWCAHVSSANSWQLATLAPEAVAAMAGRPGSTWRLSGSARPLGIARRVEGGYVVNGRWDFASNCVHAAWYCGTCVVPESGRQRTRSMFMPIEEGRVIETWQVAGLRGTGSHDFAVKDVFVPEEHVGAGRHLARQHGRLYHRRLPMVVNWALTAGVSLGIARGALDAFGTMSRLATAGATETPLRDRTEVQHAAGRSEAILGAARAYCLHAVAAAWEGAAAGPENVDLDRLVLDARLAITHALHSAVDVVTVLFHAGGTRSVFNRHHLERRFRDAHVAVQHAAGSSAHFGAGGRIALGLPSDAPFW